MNIGNNTTLKVCRQIVDILADTAKGQIGLEGPGLSNHPKKGSSWTEFNMCDELFKTNRDFSVIISRQGLPKRR